jgi:hypothetical protein
MGQLLPFLLNSFDTREAAAGDELSVKDGMVARWRRKLGG